MKRISVQRAPSQTVITIRVSKYYTLVYNSCTGLFFCKRKGAGINWQYRLVRLGGCYMNGARLFNYGKKA